MLSCLAEEFATFLLIRDNVSGLLSVCVEMKWCVIWSALENKETLHCSS